MLATEGKIAAAVLSSSYSNESSNEEEPWDQRSASVDSSTMRALAVHDQLLEEGELPALTPNTPPRSAPPVMVPPPQQQQQQPSQASGGTTPSRAGWLLRSGQTTRRPLQPPSTAGLEDDNDDDEMDRGPADNISPTDSEKDRRQKFWSQLDGGSLEEEEGPDDERAARRSSSGTGGDNNDSLNRVLRPTDGKPSRKDIPDNRSDGGHSVGEETLDYSQEGAPRGKGVANQQGADFCGETLNAFNDICGGGLEQTNSTERPDPPAGTAASTLASRSFTPRLPRKSDDQEEYTAIEVEFIEVNAPSRQQTPSLSPSSSRKKTAAVVGSDKEKAGNEEQDQTDVTAKKTAFLSALARKAKADFDRGKAAQQRMEQHQGIESKPSGEDSLDEDIYVTFSAAEKRKFLKLINTGHKPVEASRVILEQRDAKEKAQREKKEKKELAASKKSQRNKRLAFWKKNRKGSTTMPAPPSSSKSTDDEERDEPLYDDDNDEEEFQSENDESPTRSTQPVVPLIPNAAMSAMIALDVKTPRPPSPPPSPPPLEELDRIPVGAEESEDEHFARSGINYYDAVRRDASDTDDEVARVGLTPVAATPTDKKKRRVRPRGFAALRDGVRSKSAPRATQIPESISEDEPVRFVTQSRTLDSTFETAGSNEAVLQAAPTNHTHDKRAQSRGWVDQEDGTLLAKAQIAGNPSPGVAQNKALHVSIPRQDETREREETAAPKQGGHESRDGSNAPARPRGRVVADVGSGAKIGRDDEAILARIEQEILKTSSPKRNTEISEISDKGNDTTPKVKPRSISAPKSRSSPFRSEKTEEFKLELDVDIDTYMHSADIYSAVQGGGDTRHSDARSVFTAGTGASTYTQSRKRRPGAAKDRLAKAKEAFKSQSAKKKGWHESIQAAAASTNRIWQPGKGWVDYVEAPEEILPDLKSEEKLQINLKKALVKNDVEMSDESQRSIVPVPFPKDWEAQRREMIAAASPSDANSRNLAVAPTAIAGTAHNSRLTTPTQPTTTGGMTEMSIADTEDFGSTPTDVLGSGIPMEPSPDEPLPVAIKETPGQAPARRSERVKKIRKHFSPARARMAQKPEKPSGWLASMQAVTASLNKDGKSWDVQNGWSMPDEDADPVADVVDFNPPIEAGNISDVDPSESIEVSDTIDFNLLAPPPPPPPPPPKSRTPITKPLHYRNDEVEITKDQFDAGFEYDQSRQPRVYARTTSPNQEHRGIDGKLNQWVEKSGKEAKAGSSAADMSERAVASGGSIEADADGSFRVAASGVAEINTESSKRSTRVDVAAVSTEANMSGSRLMRTGIRATGQTNRSVRTVLNDAVGATTESDVDGIRSSSSVQPYVQLSENGSVRGLPPKPKENSTLVREPEERESGEDQGHRSNDVLGVFPSESELPASAAVDIQKIDEEDLNLFPEDTREKRADRGYISTQRAATRTPTRRSPVASPPLSPPPPPPSVPPSISAASSADSSRRGRGPVDTDEVDDTWDSDDDQRFSVGWESKSGSASTSPRTTPSRPIPKLKGSRRDTSPLRSRRLLARPGPEIDVLSDHSASKPDELLMQYETSPVYNDDEPVHLYRRVTESQNSPGVRARLKEWESGGLDGPPEWPEEDHDVPRSERSKPAAEWKSFIGKKVNAETAAASQQRAQVRGIRGVRSEDEDSLFHFEEKKQPITSTKQPERPNVSHVNDAREQHLSEGEGEGPAYSDVYGSEGYGPTPQDGRTFLQRLTECAAPVMASARNTVGELPSAHLAFMKAGQFSPKNPLGCARPDAIDEDETTHVDDEKRGESVKEKPRSKSNPKSRSRGGSSVASDDFGAKTAYLEAIAMKAAVSKPRRSSSRGRGGSSVASSSTSQHSEKWKSFLERKKSPGISPAKGRSSNTSDVSKAAERYAAAKVEEMMAEMNATSVSSPGTRREYPREEGDYRALRSYRAREGSRVGAAEDLAAARVEAMMTQLSGSQVEEAEI